MEGTLTALATLATPQIVAMILGGTAAGIVIGALPGLGSVLAITLALPLTFVLGPEASIILLLGLYCGSVYGGSLSAILINTPGTPQSAATVLDGYPMMQRGEGARALGWATTASVIGGLVSTLVLILAAPLLARFGLRFGPIEYFALGVLALTCVAAVAHDDLLKGAIACLLGLLAASVGQDPLTGDVRLTFGSFEMAAGIGLVPFLVGLFALSEVFWRIAHPGDGAKAGGKSGFRPPGFAEIFRRRTVLLKSSMIGTWVGTLPGVGATAAAMISYVEARRSSPNRDAFGTGEPDGLIASEAANNGVTAGALVPTLSLGIPGDPITAVMLGALVIQGITPGPRLFVDNPDLVTLIFAGLFFINVAMFALGALICPMLTRILRVPEPLLLSCVVVLIAIGTYTVRFSPVDLWIALAAGLAGLLLRLASFPLAPIVIGFVLGGTIEQSLRQGLILADGNILAFVQRPIAATLFAVTGLFLAATILRRRRKRGA